MDALLITVVMMMTTTIMMYWRIIMVHEYIQNESQQPAARTAAEQGACVTAQY
jgi:hypothetical protein